ncbi:hypothetical protein HK103_006286, partial [Boothiomyces macroporosus]
MNTEHIKKPRYKCSCCKKIGHNITTCPEKSDFNPTIDQKLIENILRLPNVWKVFPTVVYEVYMDTTKMKKRDDQFSILQGENIKIIDSRGFKTTYDCISYGSTIYNVDGIENKPIGTIGFFVSDKMENHYGVTCSHVVEEMKGEVKLSNSSSIAYL